MTLHIEERIRKAKSMLRRRQEKLKTGPRKLKTAAKHFHYITRYSRVFSSILGYSEVFSGSWVLLGILTHYRIFFDILGCSWVFIGFSFSVNMWPTSVLASRQVISRLWCETGALFGGGTHEFLMGNSTWDFVLPRRSRVFSGIFGYSFSGSRLFSGSRALSRKKPATIRQQPIARATNSKKPATIRQQPIARATNSQQPLAILRGRCREAGRYVSELEQVLQ